MQDTLEKYLLISDKGSIDIAAEVGKTVRCVNQWREKGGYTVDFDGRTNRINWINAPERRVYDRNQLSFNFDSAPGE